MEPIPAVARRIDLPTRHSAELLRSLFSGSAESLRRLVLLLYALVGTPFVVVLYLTREATRGTAAWAAVAILIVLGGAWLAIRRRPARLDWIFPVALVPTVCCGVAYAGSGAAGGAFLAVMMAPLAWAAVLFETPVVVTAWITASLTCMSVLWVAHGALVAAGNVLLFSIIAGLVAWVVHGSANQLRAVRARDRVLVEAIPDTLARADRQGRFLDVHAPPGDALPGSQAELVGRSVSEFLPPAIGDRMQAAIARAFETGELQSLEYSVRYEDVERCFEARMVPSSQDEVVVIRRDITDRRRAESERLILGALIAEMQDSIMVLDPDLRIRLWSGGSTRMYGWTAGEVVGKRVYEVFAPELPGTSLADVSAQLLAGNPVSFQGRDLVKGGARIPVLVDVTPLRNDAGELTGHLSVARDMSRQVAAERALRESEERYRLVISAAGEGIVMRLADGTISTFNEAAVRLLGATAEQMQGKVPKDPGWASLREDGEPLPDAEDPGMVALRTGRPVTNFLLGIQRRAAGVMWLSVNAQPIFRDGRGIPHAVVAAYRDVTAERLNAEEMRRSREQLAHAVEGSRLVTWEWDVETGRTSYGPVFPALLGYGPEEIEPNFQAWKKLVHPDDGPRIRSTVVQHLKGNTPGIDWEYRMRARDGSWKWIHTRGRAVKRDANGRAVQLIGTHADVTARREAEERLREALSRNEQLLQDLLASEERLRLALVAANQVEWELDVNRNELTVGAGSPAFLGRSSAPTTMHADAWRAELHPDDRRRASRDVKRCLLGAAEFYESEFRMRSAKGGYGWIRARGRVTVRDALGRPLRFIGTAAEVTELHELLEKLAASARLASVGTLAAGVAHEINNPLAWVMMNVGYALERLSPAGEEAGLPPEELHKLLDEVREGTERIAAIVKAMRTLGRPEHGTEPRDIDVRGEVLGAVQMVRNQLVQRALLDLSLPEDLPRARGMTTELGRVFLNLLTNAVQAIPEGKAPEHRIAVTARAEAGDVLVEIADTGIGMSPAVQRRIFEPFFTTKPVGQGSGLGLSIAKSILEAGGGRIEVESAPGRGTTFRVYLRAVAGEPELEVSRGAVGDPAGATKLIHPRAGKVIHPMITHTDPPQGRGS